MGDRNRTGARPAEPPAPSATRPEPRVQRRRGEHLVHAIEDAAVAEAADVGAGRLTMEGIARRAGAAKTSLYRRWSSPEDILIDALYRRFPQESPSPSADDLRGDLIRALRLMRDSLTSDPLGKAMVSVIAESFRRADLFDALWERVFHPRGGRFTRTVLLHYAERGHLDPARLTPVVVDIGEALMAKYAFDHQQAPPDEYIAAIVDQAILPAVGASPAS